MMSHLRDLYQEVIIDHSRKPRNFAKLDSPSHSARGFNALCGDQLNLYLNIQHGRIQNIKFEGSGCAISMASASLMTEALKDKSLAEVQNLFDAFHQLLTNSAADQPELGKLQVLAGVAEYPARVKCATLAWHTLQAALKGGNTIATTEDENA